MSSPKDDEISGVGDICCEASSVVLKVVISFYA